jgi:hypothetical protein
MVKNAFAKLHHYREHSHGVQPQHPMLNSPS